MTIIIEREAEQDIEEGFNWYRERSDRAAENFIKDLERTLDKLRLDPSRYRRIHNDARVIRFANYPYRLIYRITDETIKIYAADHDKRSDEYWHQRLD